MLTIAAFLVAIGVLVTVHEWGHYRMALACGVRVLQFSVGFGPEVFAWQSKRSATRYSIAWLPLGGFVKMLDEREGPVPAGDVAFAFNRKPLAARAAIVAAGPIANLTLAVMLYAGLHWSGVVEARAVLSAPPAQSIAASAGFQGGEVVTHVGMDADALQEIASYEEYRWWVAQAALHAKDLTVQVQRPSNSAPTTLVLGLSAFQIDQADESMFRTIGLGGPFTRPVLGEIQPDGAAFAAGLLQGDVVLSVNGQPISDAAQLRDRIRAAGVDENPKVQTWMIARGALTLMIDVLPRRVLDDAKPIGRIGAVIGEPPELVTVHYSLLDGFTKAVDRTWDSSVLTVHMLGQMLTGQASIKNLSGPITIADYAGRSAASGLAHYIAFLALVSISLGVLNLLPLPMLDGGHLMYYLWEAVTGRALSDAWMNRLQRIGLAILLLMMSVAVFNDLQRLLS